MGNNKVSNEVVAAITAAVEAIIGKKVVAVTIKRSEAWTMAARRDAV